MPNGAGVGGKNEKFHTTFPFSPLHSFAFFQMDLNLIFSLQDVGGVGEERTSAEKVKEEEAEGGSPLATSVRGRRRTGSCSPRSFRGQAAMETNEPVCEDCFLNCCRSYIHSYSSEREPAVILTECEN